jgi:RNA polymerase sigma-B factor
VTTGNNEVRDAGGARTGAADRTSERFREHRATRDRQVRNALVEEHLWLAKVAIRPFLSRGEPYDDLHQVALLGLVKAVERFDPAFGSRFAAFALPTMQGELRRHFRDTTWALHAPRRLQELRSTVNTIGEALTHRLGRPPTSEEVAAEAGVSVDEVLQAIEAGSAYKARSLTPSSSDRSGDGGPFVDHAALDRADLTDDGLALQALLERSSLTDQAKKILLLRFFGDMTQAEVGKIVGISQVHVSRQLQASIRHLRELGAHLELTG